MKKEWKKVLSLVMALAMVLSCCTFVFAEGEEAEETPTVQTTYDFAEFFVTSDGFTGNPLTDYGTDPEGDGTYTYKNLTRVENDNWKAVAYWDGANTPGSALRYTFRAGHASRAWSDDKNTTLTLKEGATNSTVRIPNMVASYNIPGYTEQSTTSDLEKHWDGTDSVVYGDNGFASTTFWPYGGLIGYGFSNGTGYGNMAPWGRVHLAAVFTAPRAGFVSPTVRIFTNDVGIAAYRVYRNRVVDGVESWTNIYPAEGTGSTITASYALEEHEANGWVSLAAGVDEKRSDGVIWVEAGDQIILRIASQNGTDVSSPMALDTFKIDYVSELDMTYFPDTRTVDVRQDGAPEGTTYTVAENSGLVATDVAGVFAVADTYVDGTAVPVTVTVGTTTATINVTLTCATYDLAEAFYTTNDYSESLTAAEKYAAKSQTPAITNDGSDIWAVGYFEKSNLTKLYPYAVLQRPKGYRAYEDTLYDRTPAMTWTIAKAYFGSTADGVTVSGYTNDADNGYSLLNTNAAKGSLTYNYGSDTYLSNSGAGHISYNGNSVHVSAIFTAPMDGVINPVLKAAASTANTISYRMYKVDAAGTYTQIYPSATESASWIQPTTDWDGAYPISDICNTNWAYLPASGGGWMVQDKGAVRVAKGDKIYLRFAGTNGSESFGVSQLTMNYLGRFGANDELLLEAPFAAYEEETINLVTPRDAEIDLSREILNTEAKGTMEYTITGNTEILRATATAGLYELTGEINAGGTAATVTAGYYSAGNSSANGDAPLYTTSVDVYVNAASMGVDTFTYDLFKASQLGYDGDGFLLPYYTDATERAMYGEIDLGLTDEWKGATVTISDTSKVQYLGNGRVRVLAKHDFKDAGGTFPKWEKNVQPTTTAAAYNGNPAIRDTTTAGASPVVMTVKAPDGGVRKFNLWSFNAAVQGDAASETYGFNYSGYYVGNEVTSLEGYIDMTATNGGSFEPMYRDSGVNTMITPVADDMYLSGGPSAYWNGRVPTFTNTGSIDFWAYNQSGWEGMTNSTYVDYDGVAWAFTAPKDGTVNIANHLTDYLHSSVPGWWVKDTLVGSVRKYALDGSYTTLLEYTYDDYGAFDIPCDNDDGVYKANTETNPMFNRASTKTGTMVDALDETDGSMNVDVKKDEVIRVILACNADSKGWVSTFLPEANNANKAVVPGVSFLPNPTFTYVQTGEYADGFDSESNMLVVVPSTVTGLENTGVLAILYSEAGQILEVIRGIDQDADGNDKISLDTESGAVGISYFASTAAYAKVFFWEDLGNIQPLAGDILVRK